MKISEHGLYELRVMMMLARHRHRRAGCPQHLQPLLGKFRSKMISWKPNCLLQRLGTLAIPRERTTERGADYRSRDIGSSREYPASMV
jgi:hypothetical protein